jgi:hypothetical protein
MDPGTDDKDKYGRTLAHVWTVDRNGEKGLLVGEMIVWEGHAVPRGQGHAYQRRFEKARTRAERKGRGSNLGVPESFTAGRNSPSKKMETSSNLGIFEDIFSDSEDTDEKTDEENGGRDWNGSDARQLENSGYWRPDNQPSND